MRKSKKKSKFRIKEIYSISNPNAPLHYVEAYKMIATNIEFIAVAQDCKNIMVTSALENEGKTNSVVNLSIALAGYGKKVCLIDCDLRRPSLHLLQRNAVGLTHVLKGEVSLQEAIFKYKESENLDILSAGMIPPNPTELLASRRMQKVIEELEKDYDFLIYDTSPCIGISDVSVLGRYMDAAIITVRHNSTDKKVAARAKANLTNAGVNVIGSIITDYSVDSDVSNSYYSYGGSYYGDQED